MTAPEDLNYTISSRELVAENDGMRVQVLTLQDGEIIPGIGTVRSLISLSVWPARWSSKQKHPGPATNSGPANIASYRQERRTRSAAKLAVAVDLPSSKALASTTISRLGSLLASSNNSTFERITAFASRRIAEGCTVALLTTGALRE